MPVVKESKQINWKDKFVELVVVVIGITLAFMMNRSYENHKNKQVEYQYLQSFKDDIGSDLKQLDTLLRHQERQLQKIKNSQSLFSRSTINPDSAMTLIGALTTIYIYSSQKTTYETIKSSGNFNILSDYRLKQALIKYYQGMDDLKYLRQTTNFYYNTFVIPFILKNVDLHRKKIVSLNALRNRRFRNMVYGFQSLLIQKYTMHKELYQSARTVMTLLKQI